MWKKQKCSHKRSKKALSFIDVHSTEQDGRGLAGCCRARATTEKGFLPRPYGNVSRRYNVVV